MISRRPHRKEREGCEEHPHLSDFPFPLEIEKNMIFAAVDSAEVHHELGKMAFFGVAAHGAVEDGVMGSGLS